MRVGLAQINPTVGDLASNRRLILDAYQSLVAQGAELVAFPELAVCGYPPRDLLFKRRFVRDCEDSLQQIAAQIGSVPALIGTVTRNTTGSGRPTYNAAAFCRAGQIVATARKCLLPTYDVFDEDRYFEPASAPIVVEHAGARIGITICEDIWTHPMISTRQLHRGADPVQQLAAQHCDLMVNVSASPWHFDKDNLRETLIADTARALGCATVYLNVVGGNDELIFDGRSLACTADGSVIEKLPAFQDALRVIDVPSTHVPPTARKAAAPAATLPARLPAATGCVASECADTFDALVLGLRDYAHKSGFKRALIALSGGIDSALVAVIATAALGAENVTGVSLPSAISSQHSRDDARQLAQNLGIRFETIAIAEPVAATEAVLADAFRGRTRDVTEENIQARIRGVIMMALSNKFGALLLTTGNKSEMAVGYCTLYGDMAGGLAVISDLYKTQVYSVARWINQVYAARLGRTGEIIPASTITKPPSAELRPDQLDQDSLPPYDVLDAILRSYVEEGHSRRDIVAQGFAEAVVNDVVRKVDLNEYKRKQAAPGLKITPLAFGVGRRIPIVQKYVS
ncbi:NAD+ synthase [Opitutus terrae]|uniref:Glutamine-dependent NAD(+) synthetase n=1 Tax=Opitutus terrae (strain DSM 11246 / JCM 15787 / PB90-1) TaxID=452637 RepID=B1ZYD3_OPITP|nr:NAD+ synthase [Opitutus terrae]ACB77031.1 NAD+ synthetase [Opitutus terrae PB90-1]